VSVLTGVEYVLNLDEGVQIESTGLRSVWWVLTLGRYADCRADGRYDQEERIVADRWPTDAQDERSASDAG
jgi:hypothetical protein